MQKTGHMARDKDAGPQMGQKHRSVHFLSLSCLLMRISLRSFFPSHRRSFSRDMVVALWFIIFI